MYINHYSKAISEVIEDHPENAERYLRAMGEIILECTHAQIVRENEVDLNRQIENILGKAYLTEVLGVLISVESLIDGCKCPNCEWEVTKSDLASTYHHFLKYYKAIGLFVCECPLCGQRHVVNLPEGKRQTRRDIDILEDIDLTAENVTGFSGALSDKQLVKAFKKAEREWQNIDAVYHTLKHEIEDIREIPKEEQMALSLMD